MNTNITEEAAKGAGGLGAELSHKVQIFEGFNIDMPGFDFSLFGQHININPFTIHITETVITMWIVMAFMIIAAYILTRNLTTFPGKRQNVVEIIVDGINSLTKNMIGHHWKHFSAYFGTVLLFLIFCNTIAVFEIETLRPPTKDFNIPAAMAVMTILLVIGSQLRFKKLGGTLKSWLEPVPIMLPFHLMDYIVRPLSLCFRLFGNIFGAFIMMELIILVSHKFLLPPFMSLYFDIFDGILQAFIFTFLSMLYVGEAIE